MCTTESLRSIDPWHRGSPHLAFDAFSADVELLWLAPLHDAAERIYQRVGFEVASETLHISFV